MKCKFQRLEAIEGQRKDGTAWTGVKIHGIRYDNGAEWVSSGIFDSDRELKDYIEELRTTDQGTPIDVVHKKNGKFWDITEIKIGDEVVLDPVVKKYEGGMTPPNRGTKSGSSGGGNSDKMSKEEWAAKDAKKSKEIAKSVALKAAVDNTAPDTDATTVIELAEIFEDYLLGNGDPLAPPKED
jgi:hypothetical protein